MTQEYKNSFSGKGVFPPKYAFTLLIPFRNIFFSPKKLLERLDLDAGHRVLEIGPGPGYFSTYVAKQLTQGRLVLLDIQQEMLDYAKKRLHKRKLTNVDFVVTDGKRFDLEDQSFDRVFMVSVIGEVENQDQYLQEIHRVMKKEGILSLTELAGDPDRLTAGEIQALVTKHPFEVTDVFSNRLNVTINFKKL